MYIVLKLCEHNSHYFLFCDTFFFPLFSSSHPSFSIPVEQCAYSCTAPSAPGNGYIVSVVQDGRPGSFSRSGLHIGAIATIACSHGYYLHGSSSLTCGPNGVWHGQQAMCLPCELYNIQHYSFFCGNRQYYAELLVALTNRF